MLMTSQLWFWYLLPVVSLLFLGLFTGCYWEVFNELRDGKEDFGQSS